MRGARILIIDDEPNVRQSFSSLLKDEGHLTTLAETAEAGLARCKTQAFDLILLDLGLPGMSGLDFLDKLRESGSSSLVLVISGQTNISSALRAVRSGAIDYLEKPVPAEKLIASVNASLMVAEANRQRDLMVDSIEAGSRMFGKSSALAKLLGTISQVAPTDSTVLILGENGTGKELAASQTYLQSSRRNKPFIRVNCPGIPEMLFESELFGHKKGAFTGAVKDHPGKFVLADQGTIFLDEIGDLPLSCQAKLLRVLENGEVETLGSTDKREVDVRVICATNQDLAQLVSEGKFRQDLYYRISVFVLDLPPLRERADDIPLLIGEFLKRYDPTGRTTISPEAIAWLSSLDYPGNIRQLKNTIERLCILCREREIQIADLDPRRESKQTKELPQDKPASMAEKMKRYEKELIARALDKCESNISEAARLLQIERSVMSRKVKEFDLKNR